MEEWGWERTDSIIAEAKIVLVLVATGGGWRGFIGTFFSSASGPGPQLLKGVPGIRNQIQIRIPQQADLPN